MTKQDYFAQLLKLDNEIGDLRLHIIETQTKERIYLDEWLDGYITHQKAYTQLKALRDDTSATKQHIEELTAKKQDFIKVCQQQTRPDPAKVVDKLYNIFLEENEANDIADTYFPKEAFIDFLEDKLA